MESKELIVNGVYFDNPPFVIHGLTKHLAVAEDGTKVSFFMKEPLEAGASNVKIYHLPRMEGDKEVVKKDKFGVVQLLSARLEPHPKKQSSGQNRGGRSGNWNRGSSYNNIQEKRLEYEKNSRDPRLTVQGIMSNYTKIAIAAFTAGKTAEQTGEICDWVMNKSIQDFKKLWEAFEKEE